MHPERRATKRSEKSHRLRPSAEWILTGSRTIDIASITRKRELLEPNDPAYGIHVRREEVIVGRKIEICGGSVCDQLYNCTFRDCEIRLKGGGRFIGVATAGLLFESCLIWAAKPMIIATWEAVFIGCYFRGRFEARFTGPVVDCNFANATLRFANFKQTESLGQIAWPPWPHIVIDHPAANFHEWETIANNERLTIPLRRQSGIAAILHLTDYVESPDAFWNSIGSRSFIHRHSGDPGAAQSIETP